MIKNERNRELPIIRVMTGIRNMGYTFESAILDIVDNSIVAKSKNIKIFIQAEDDTRDQSIKRIIIEDDGTGMNEDQIFNALELGSSESQYEENSLSKYGFGLKSAGFSQANSIAVISKTEACFEWHKARVGWDLIEEYNKYVVDEDLELDLFEQRLVEAKAKGTIIILDGLIKVSKIKKDTAVKRIVERCAITYHRFMEEDDLNIKVNDKCVEPYDPLFCNEIKENMIDYDGRKVCKYFDEDYSLVLNSKNKSKATIKAVLLPNPPLFEKEGMQKKVNAQYHMKQKNIGFYIYRNRRLIVEATTLSLFSRSEPKLLASRIRIDLDTICDDEVNLDVKKTQLVFPERFMEQLRDLLNPYFRRSKDLWDEMKIRKANADQEVITDSDTLHKRSNEMLKSVAPVVVDPQTGGVQPMQELVVQQIDNLKRRYDVDDSVIEEIRKKNNQRIITVSELPKGMLWGPAIGGENSCQVVVHISRQHPFYEKVYKKLEDGCDAVVILDALFLNLAMAEMGINCGDTKYEKIFAKLRQSVSHQLENFIDLELDDEGDESDENL